MPIFYFFSKQHIMAVTLACFSAVSMAAMAGDISVIGLFPGKAVLVIDGAQPKTYSVGDNLGNGSKLVEADSNGATIETNGKKRTIQVGQHFNRAPASSQPTKVTLQADSRGHYLAEVLINGRNSMRMIVDTGATSIALPAAEARRMGIDYSRGKQVGMMTANGPATAYQITLDSVRIDNLELKQVEAVVQEGGLSVGLLGMSFLGRLEMANQGRQMTLTKPF
jgi:aspartyl protease family protein